MIQLITEAAQTHTHTHTHVTRNKNRTGDRSLSVVIATVYYFHYFDTLHIVLNQSIIWFTMAFRVISNRVLHEWKRCLSLADY